MDEKLMHVIWIILIVGAIGIFELVFAVYYVVKNKKMNRLSGRSEGVITGLLKSHLFKNETHGEVPGGAIIGWGVAQGEQYWGGMLKVRIPPWFPCVKYEIDGKEFHRIMGEGAKSGAWEIGQKVHVLYEPGNPYIALIEGDDSYKNKTKQSAFVGGLFIIICIAAIVYATMLV